MAACMESWDSVRKHQPMAGDPMGWSSELLVIATTNETGGSSFASSRELGSCATDMCGGEWSGAPSLPRGTIAQTSVTQSVDSYDTSNANLRVE